MQNNSLVSLFTKTIHKDFQLKRNGCFWILKNKHNGESLNFRAKDRNSFAFSLDKDNIQKQPFAFFSTNPPTNLTKICDAIIVVEYEQKALIVAIEQKSTNKKDYTKQLNNAKYFCDWLINLFKAYNYYKEYPIFCKLLCWKPRKIPSKGQTSHHDSNYNCRKSKISFFDFSCEVQNKSKISLLEIAKIIKKIKKNESR